MTEFEVNPSTKQYSNKNLGLNKSNLYSPHASLKNMSKQITIGTANHIEYENSNNNNNNNVNSDYCQNNLDEDIYDFSSVKRQINLNENGLMNNYTDEDEEEEDINFDYEYGYDYERVIKDRLRKVNQEFVNDSEPPKRKSVLVSFDNAVTAIDIPNETSPEIPEENKVSTQKKLSFAAAKSVQIADDQESEQDNIGKKLPLNDTVQKEDPDAFANKIKQAVMKYDAELKNQMMLENEKPDEINEYFRDAFPDYSDQSNQALNKDEEYKENEFEEEYIENKTEEQPVRKDSNLSSSPIQTTNNNNNNIINSNNNLKSSTPSPPLHKLPTTPQVPDFSIKNNESPKTVKLVDDNDIDNKSKVPKQPITKVPSFSASSKMNEASPSPISSPEPKFEVKSKQTENTDDSNLNQQSSTNSSTSSSSEKQTLSDLKTTDEKTKESNEKMLVEKDGIFKLMSPEEYTAYEKQKQAERQAALNSNNNKIPYPPTRPKTSVPTTGNRNNSLKNRFINNSNQNLQLPVRYSQSADPNGRRKELTKNNVSINNRRTPDYAQDYKSPYHVQFKVVKQIADSAEEKRKKEKEEEERRINNEMAFKSWLRIKEEQRTREEKQKQKNNKNEENSCSTNNSDENNKHTYEYWLLRKQEQLEVEREFKKKLEQLEQQERKTVTPEERSKAFREWINRKLREKNEAMKLEKLENKKWIARRRRSRKHQRLSQALELAQAYGYNSSFYSPGFNF